MFPLKPDAEGDVKAVNDKLVQVRKNYNTKINSALNYDFINEESLSKFLRTLPPISVCNIMQDGVPIHPTGVHESGGYVNNTIQFGGCGIDEKVIARSAQYIETSFINEVLETLPVYTKGTQQGLHVRMKQQLSWPVKVYPYSIEHFSKKMDRHLPIHKNQLLNWNQDLYELFELVETSYASSSGAPMWRKKGECVDTLLDCVLPLLCESINRGELRKLMEEQPEMFIAVLKAKDDRYKDPTEKTRPYLALPWGCQTLFSVLCQSFCRSMKIFYEADGCVNAYGFSWANGGATKMYKWLMSATPGKPRCAIYGDDCIIASRDKDNNVHFICPDFKQMDGSVDSQTVSHTIDYIYNCFAEQHGENGFWKVVCNLWKEMALDPIFLVQGTTAYRKQKGQGIMSGVVGTTLFDTVKAMLAYTEFLDIHTHPELLSEAEVVTWFQQNHGLTIKPTTWSPEMVMNNPSINQPVSSLKFLGMRMQPMMFRDETIIVPVLDDEEWFANLITPKQIDAKSRFAAERYLFDRLRGLLTTGGVFSPFFRRLAASLLFHIPSSAIVVKVQTDNGRGSRPEFVKVVGEDFHFENSSGWPSLDWALNLYAPEDLKDSNIKMASIFNDPDKLLESVPQRKPIQPLAVVVDVKTNQDVVSSTVIPVEVAKPEPVVPDITSSAPLAPQQDTKLPEKTKRSPYKNWDTSKGEVVNIDNKPSLMKQIVNLIGPVEVIPKKPVGEDEEKLAEAFDNLIHRFYREKQTKGNAYIHEALMNNRWGLIEETLLGLILDGHDIKDLELYSIALRQLVTVSFVASKLGQSQEIIKKLCREMGYFVFGPDNCLYISSSPIAPTDKVYQKQLDKQEEENISKLKEVKQQIKDQPISKKTNDLLVQKNTLKDVVDRAMERPSVLPTVEPDVPMAQPEETAKIKKFIYAGVDARQATGYSKRALHVAAARILKENRMGYHTDTTQVPYKFYLYDLVKPGERHLFFIPRPNQNAYISFYEAILKKYIQDVSLTDPQLQDISNDWNEVFNTEKAIRIRLLKIEGRPSILSVKGKGSVVIDHLDKFKMMDGQLYVETSHGSIPVSLQKMSTAKDRLARILGNQVDAELLTYSEFVQSFKQFDEQLGVSELIRETTQKNKDNFMRQTRKSPERSIAEANYKAAVNFAGEKRRAPLVNQVENHVHFSTNKNRRSPSQRSRPQSKEKQEKQQQSKYYGNQKPRTSIIPGTAGEPYIVQEPPEMVNEEIKNSQSNNGWFRLPGNSNNVPIGPNWNGSFYNLNMPYGMGWYPCPSGSFPMAAVPPPFFGPGNYNFSQQDDGRPISGSMVGGLGRSGPHQRRGRSQ